MGKGKETEGKKEKEWTITYNKLLCGAVILSSNVIYSFVCTLVMVYKRALILIASLQHD